MDVDVAVVDAATMHEVYNSCIRVACTSEWVGGGLPHDWMRVTAFTNTRMSGEYL